MAMPASAEMFLLSLPFSATFQRFRSLTCFLYREPRSLARRRATASVVPDVFKRLPERLGRDADLAAERKVELYDQGDDDDNRAGETG